MKEPVRPFIYFFIPYAYERLTLFLSPFFEKEGYVVACYEYSVSKDFEREMDEFFYGEENAAVVIFPEEISSFCDSWVKATINKSKGNPKQVINYIKSKGIPTLSYPMDWGGPFDDSVVIYGNDERIVKNIISEIEQIL